ncbi:MAG: ABC transporter ATP-binding protein/permease [Clostridia bacterium]|nr:ATP-binding cassette domain-containing protein [Lachnospiraceae bacterium]NCC00211.1 ABC transporter ATP-binding protein/permease [Clostridia bacterium]NCD03313.1 ABC transporter ATP-binding protein/permease [Clostridia bacterium]
MLQLKNIGKEYVVGNMHVKALKDINITFRKNEFVSILGPSGGGKTTLLNIIGGLDHASQGDLIINGKSTKKFKDRDWDSYRNHSIGFVFQSYNLIPHQTVLANVELALTLSGVGAKERKKRAAAALAEVGLGDQLKKKPNQLSGGQMQRVAIARALVNDPEILLADEPTGALDTETSIQVMDILKKVAENRLVVMVTHNPELAETYSTRIVRIKDGAIIGDSQPFDEKEEITDTSKQKKTTMSFWTALSLSRNNLWTKKGRTILTAFAGSIGIIGIAMILALSGGVNKYIADLQTDTMVSYPIVIDSESIDLSGMMEQRSAAMSGAGEETEESQLNEVYADNSDMEASAEALSVTENNLTAFKKYLDNPDSEIQQYLGQNGVVYSYNVRFKVFSYDPEDVLVDADFEDQMSGMGAMGGMISSGNSNFEEIMSGTDGELISPVVTDSYDMLYGEWPQSYDEVVLVLDEKNEISSKTLYQLGILPKSEYDDIMEEINDGEEVTFENKSFSYEDICNQTFYMIPSCDLYVENEDGTFKYVGDDELMEESLVKDALELKISGVIRGKDDVSYTNLDAPVGYTSALTDYLIDYTDKSPVVKAQEDTPETDVLTGMKFEPANDTEKVEDAVSYLSALDNETKAAVYSFIMGSAAGNVPTEETEETMETEDVSGFAGAMGAGMDEAALAEQLNQYLENPDKDMMLQIYDSYIKEGSYEQNMESFGKVSHDAPSSISIYADSFEDKDAISVCIENYNSTVGDEDKIAYTDYVGLLTSSITSIVNIISYVLIAFVAVSLVVSCIMIGIITHISVMERTKEIGILRAIGAAKKDISRVFNAETFIIGLCSGGIGIGVTYLLQIPVNAVIHIVAETNDVNASLSVTNAVILVILSVALTLIAGFFPARGAAKKDPVTALRSE